MSDEPTLPPVREPNTFKTWLPRIWNWIVAESKMHPMVAMFLGGMATGWLLPKIIIELSKIFG